MKILALIACLVTAVFPAMAYNQVGTDASGNPFWLSNNAASPFWAHEAANVASFSNAVVLVSPASGASVTTNTLATTNYVNNATNLTLQAATNYAGQIAQSLTNGFTSSGITNGFTDSRITNSLASIVFAESLTNGFTDPRITNGLLTTTYGLTLTNGLTDARITNGLASITYANTLTNTTLAIATNSFEPTNANLATFAVTNGLTDPRITNGLASVVFANTLTNLTLAMATNSFQPTNANTALNTVTNGLASLTAVVAATNGLGSMAQQNNTSIHGTSSGIALTISDTGAWLVVGTANVFATNTTTAAGLVTCSLLVTNACTAWLTDMTSHAAEVLGAVGPTKGTNYQNGCLLVASNDLVMLTNVVAVSATVGTTLIRSDFNSIK